MLTIKLIEIMVLFTFCKQKNCKLKATAKLNQLSYKLERPAKNPKQPTKVKLNQLRKNQKIYCIF